MYHKLKSNNKFILDKSQSSRQMNTLYFNDSNEKENNQINLKLIKKQTKFSTIKSSNNNKINSIREEKKVNFSKAKLKLDNSTLNISVLNKSKFENKSNCNNTNTNHINTNTNTKNQFQIRLNKNKSYKNMSNATNTSTNFVNTVLAKFNLKSNMISFNKNNSNNINIQMSNDNIFRDMKDKLILNTSNSNRFFVNERSIDHNYIENSKNNTQKNSKNSLIHIKMIKNTIQKKEESGSKKEIKKINNFQKNTIINLNIINKLKSTTIEEVEVKKLNVNKCNTTVNLNYIDKEEDIPNNINEEYERIFHRKKQENYSNNICTEGIDNEYLTPNKTKETNSNEKQMRNKIESILIDKSLTLNNLKVEGPIYSKSRIKPKPYSNSNKALLKINNNINISEDLFDEIFNEINDNQNGKLISLKGIYKRPSIKPINNN